MILFQIFKWQLLFYTQREQVRHHVMHFYPNVVVHAILSNFLTVSATAFYKCQPVVEFLCEVLRKSLQDLQRGKPLTDAERMKLSREIKGLKVEITHCGTMKREYRVINVTKQPAQSLKFPLKQMDTGQQREITVARYFQEKHSKKLQWVHMVILNMSLLGDPMMRVFTC